MADSAIAELLNQVSLEELARRLELDPKHVGSIIRARCPFHDDKKPSLVLYPAREGGVPHCHCFACNAHGDAIHLVKQVKSVGFREALDFLQEFSGYSIGRSRSRGKPRTAPHYLTGYELAWKLYQESTNANTLKAFLKKRHLSTRLASQTVLATTEGNSLAKAVKNLDRRQIDSLEETGLLRLRRYTDQQWQTTKLDLDRAYYDFFYASAVIFPIRDVKGQVTGLASRYTKAAPNRPRYMYSPGFPKARSFYGIDRLVKQLRNRPSELSLNSEDAVHVFVVEGFMDVLRLKQLKLPAIGLLGSRLSVHGDVSQYTVLNDLAEEVAVANRTLALHLCLDADEAGRAGTHHAVKALTRLMHSQPNVVTDVVVLRQKKDPDEAFIGNKHEEALQSIQSCSLSPLEFSLSYLMSVDAK